MGLFSLSFAGGSLILIGAWDSLSPSSSPHPHKTHRFSTLTLLSTAFLSLLFISDSVFSLLSAVNLNDRVGVVLQLQVLSISALFFLFSFLGLLNNLSKSIKIPFIFLDLILLFAFVEEFLVYYLHLKDPDGVENRYFSLMLVPLLICIVSTVVELKNPGSDSPKIARGLGLVLQGTWFFQMGLSFYTNLIAHNCAMYHKSRGNYTMKCNAHMDTHRAGAIAVLLFNCYLALLVAIMSGVYSVFGKWYVDVGDYGKYRMISEGGSVQGVIESNGNGKFTLDEDDSDDGGGINEDNKREEVSVDMSSRENGGGAIEMQ